MNNFKVNNMLTKRFRKVVCQLSYVMLFAFVSACFLFSGCKRTTLEDKPTTATTGKPGLGTGLRTSSISGITQLKLFDYPPGNTNRLFLGVACGNFDGSGIATMAMIKRATSNVIFMRSGNDGNHYQIPYSFNITANDFKGVAAGDMDGDGVDELVILRNGAGSTNILVYKIPADFSGSVTLAASLQVGTGSYNWKGVAVGDFDGDGKADVVVAKDAHSQFIFYSLSAGTLVQKGFLNLPDGAAVNAWGGVAAGDLDGDGRAEFIAVRNGTATDKDMLVYKISGTSTWTISAAGSFNYAGGTTNYPWLGVTTGEFDGDKTNGKEIVVYKNSSPFFSYLKYNGTSTAPSVLSTQNFDSDTSWPWTGISSGQVEINTGSDQLVSIRKKTGAGTIGVYGDETTLRVAKKAALSRNGFSFGSYDQAIIYRNSDNTLNVDSLKAFCENNKIYTFEYMIADAFKPAGGSYNTAGTEYLSFVQLLELLKSTGSPIKVIALLVPPSESNGHSFYLPNPGDSPYIGSAELGGGITDERTLFTGTPKANDFPAWFKLLGILGNKYPNLAGVSIDDYSNNIVETGTTAAFNRKVVGKMMKNLRAQNENMAFLPVVYNSMETSANLWVREYTDGFVYYFRNQQAKDATLIVPPDVTRTGTGWNMHGAVVLPSTDIAGGKNYVNTEINGFASWMATSKLLLMGIYASTHSASTTAPTAFTTDKLMGNAKSNTNCDGVMIYTLQQPSTPIGAAVYARFNSWW